MVPSQTNRVLITGATGYIGSHLAERLVNEHIKVHVILRPKSSLANLEKIRDQLELHYHDGSTDNMLEIVQHAMPSVVFHLASHVVVQHSHDDIIPLINSNILFGSQLLEALIINQTPYLINTSTYWQHYNNETYNPVCLYASTKQAFEDIIQYYSEATQLKVITLKLFDTYGPGDIREKIFTLLLKAFKEQRPLPMSPGEQLLDLVYIDDVVEAYFIAAQHIKQDTLVNHDYYSISSGKPVSLREIVALIEQELKETLDVEWGGNSYRDRQVMSPWTKGKKLPGWQPQINLKEGIRRIVKGNI